MKHAVSAATILLLAAAAPAFAQSRPPAQVGLDNRRAATLTALTVADAQGKVLAQLNKPLAAGKKGVLRLARTTGCELTVQARFDDEGEVDETVNLCREKVLRFTE